MDRHIREYYSAFSDETPKGQFHSVIALNDEPNLKWEELVKKVPGLCKGWYELTHLTASDRLEFVCDYWMTRLPYRAGLKEFLMNFFNELDDIAVYIYQKKFDDPFRAELVYSLKEGKGFFKGLPGVDIDELTRLQQAFPNYIFPEDFLGFLKVHNGFSKATDVSGLIPAYKMKESYINFQEMLSDQLSLLTTTDELSVEPKSLIPFYESFGMPFFQCFYGEWYPEQEMGNVYYSLQTNTISDISGGSTGPESMAFPTFIDWLMFYLESVE